METMSLPNSVNKRKERGRIVLICVFCLIAILQSGLRDMNNLPSGNDTPNYYYIYQGVERTSWNELLSGISFYNVEYEIRDPGYAVFIKATQLISKSFTFFMFLTAIFFMVPFGLFVNRFVKSYLGIILTFLLFFALFSNIINSFMRQAISLGLVLFAIKYVINRDWKKYIGLFLIAFFIHSSSIIAAPLYLLPKISKTRKRLVIALVLSPILIFFSDRLFSSLVVGTVYEIYADSNVENPVNYIILVFVISLGAIAFFNNLKHGEHYELLMSGVIGSLLILPIVVLGNTMLRISYYYVLFIIPLVAVIIDSLKIRQDFKNAIYLLLILVFLFYIIR